MVKTHLYKSPIKLNVKKIHASAKFTATNVACSEKRKVKERKYECRLSSTQVLQ